MKLVKSVFFCSFLAALAFLVVQTDSAQAECGSNNSNDRKSLTELLLEGCQCEYEECNQRAEQSAATCVRQANNNENLCNIGAWSDYMNCYIAADTKDEEEECSDALDNDTLDCRGDAAIARSDCEIQRQQDRMACTRAKIRCTDDVANTVDPQYA